MNTVNRRQNGFTLVELLMYITIIGGLLMTVSAFFTTTVEARIKTQSIIEVDQQGALAMDYITQTIRNADSIASPAATVTANTLTLNVPTPALNQTVFSLSGTTLQVKEGAAAAIALTNSKVTVSNLSFKNLTRSGTPGIVQVSFKISRVNPTGRNSYSYEKTFTSSAALRWP